ncbi:MAG: carboxypeptidase regulatory-like domain-containing protein [Proteobacteria bacterium]|nr:carboxypeptidase regulatory-like domain-containing protein [Pseudomonadota bacterium]
MTRLSLILILAAFPLGALAQSTCSVSGTAYDFQGRPLKDAVVRLTDTRTRHAAFLVTDARAGYAFADLAPGAHYRVDLLSAPTVVTGTHLPTRSIVGMSSAVACSAGQLARADVRTQVD